MTTVELSDLISVSVNWEALRAALVLILIKHCISRRVM
jgi:hypothetical protein